MQTAKQKVSQLISKVLTGKKDVKTAMKEFPAPNGDYSLVAAWHALIHYEADEDLREKDLEYATAQYEFLIFIAEQFAQDNDLPQNIIREYIDFYDDTLVAKKKSWRNCWGIFDKSLNI